MTGTFALLPEGNILTTGGSNFRVSYQGATGNDIVLTALAAAKFFTVAPCRIADTRNPTGPYGGPALDTNSDRSFVVAGQCGIPATAQAVAFNFAIVQPTSGGNIRVYPGGGVLPLSAAMNYSAGQIRANNAIVNLGPAGDVLVHLGQGAGTTAHLVIDVNGYFQ